MMNYLDLKLINLRKWKFLNSLVRYRWKIIFGTLVLFYLSLGLWSGIHFYLVELGGGSTVRVCPLEAAQSPMESSAQEPNFTLCQPIQSQFGFKQMIFAVLFMPLYIGLLSGGIAFILPVFGLFALDKLWQAKKHTLALIPLVGTLTILFLTISLDFSIRVQTPDQLRNIRFGLPLRFIMQDQHYAPEHFPYIAHFSSLLENPTRILWPEFITSFLLVFIVNFLVLKGLVLSLQSLRLRRSKF